MKIMNRTLLLFIVIIIEGYVVLSTEILAIRQSYAYVGSGTDTISIIIAAVLMPLAIGYQYGGRFKPKTVFGHHFSVRQKLIFNIVLAATILIWGMSYESHRNFFEMLPKIGIEDRIAQISLYSVLFLVLPIYLLGQTVPLISNFFSKERLSEITGKVLFFSTVGSFLGAVFSTLFLMPYLGVHHTVSLNFVLLSILVILLSKNKKSKTVVYMILLAVFSILLNSDAVMKNHFIRKNNQYNTITAGELASGNRLLKINGNFSSMYNDKQEKFEYVEFAERVALKPIANAYPPKNILVIGAGGFTFGHEDKNNHYTFVDIDKDLKEVSEKYILKEPIGENKTFVAKPARAFLNDTKELYDVIFLDAYTGGITMPEHLGTKEFFEHIKEKLNKNGVLITNFIMSPSFANDFSINLDDTFRSVFRHASRHAIGENYNIWTDSENVSVNIAYIYKNRPELEKEPSIYTDNKNTIFMDKPKQTAP